MGLHRKLSFWTHSGVKVYDNIAAPTSWTDLDLSSVVGKNRVLVFLKIKNRDAATVESYAIRVGGETEDVANDATILCGINIVGIDPGHIMHIPFVTDANGIIEWASSGGYNTDVWVLGYVK